jgi:phosphoribosylformylglycinamidine (FGAM) synthase-like enzyme
MAIGGGIGATLDVNQQRGQMRWDLGLFSESPSRWVVEVPRRRAKTFEKLMAPVPVRRIGTVEGDRLLAERGAAPVLDVPVADLRDAWTSPLWRAMG